MDIVLVPVFTRAEYLYLCLEHLRAARGGSDKRVWVAQDRHHDKPSASQIADVDAVIRDFAGVFPELRLIRREPHTYIGNVFNFLEAYREALASDARYVYCVEDDVVVAPDFFEWHEAAQAHGGYFCSVAWHCIRNPEVRANADPAALIESARDYSSIGVCWKRENLVAIVAHAGPAYYAGHVDGYFARMFPQSPIPAKQWTEQAGLVMRVLLDTPGAVVVWAGLPRCAHIGIHGYHRVTGYKFNGGLRQRVDDLRAAAADTHRLMSLSRDPFDDVSALAQIPAWKPEELHVVQRFEDKRA